MSEIQPRIVAEIRNTALIENFAAIADRVPGQSIIPMIKADAYGHGAAWVGRTLAHLPKLYALGVATLEEGARLRADLGGTSARVKILVFSGATAWSEEKGTYCERHGLTPVIASDPDWEAFFSQGWARRIPYELKFNTGMNRLGITPELTPSIQSDLAGQSGARAPDAVLSHLAIGEDARARLSRLQLTRFRELRGAWESWNSSICYHLANSAGIWNAKGFGLQGLTHAVRPGLALYGIRPWPTARASDLTPAMVLKTFIAMRRELKQGERIGYGGVYRARKMRESAAIVFAGYADGLHRLLTEEGQVWLNGRKERFLGRISMDLSAISCARSTPVGAWAELLGPHLDAWKQAAGAGTIPYELYTSISGRVQRVYLD
jgi:alanine racemase